MSGIRVVGLTKRFGDLLVIDNLSFDVLDGEILCMVGPSGCGKSTILRAIVGLDREYEGEIWIDGELVTEIDSRIGFVFQEHALFMWRTVIENVEFGLEVRGVDKQKRREIAQKAIRIVGLEGFENAYPHELSGGMKQRAALARVFVISPEVILMDEPFAAVDAQTRNLLQEELIEIWQRRKRTILFVTHSIDEATYLGDRILVLDRRPSKIKKIFENRIPRPRDRTSIECIQLRRDVLRVLREARGEL
ncbi:nitrate ABC transporter ATP-binding protein [Methanosarcinales archaeon]|uniref:Nitrate ABC transporter ATP-binding protein n=1 Tax=Candidatus Syntropharchaeum caldarium TaxID=1838285 RepID=A0A1F2PBB2_9EURY|nr:MAG: nitrate ABC transporter ATP-binding protein [Candidatus Syntrophoarchaeum caldarius]RLG32664.1 MAG: nitrate ABC transporter ATP-binding protein [Methanosarcinales archaeon]